MGVSLMSLNTDELEKRVPKFEGLDPKTPVFEQPWEAKVFALVVQLQESGRFTWDEWEEELAKSLGDNPDLSSDEVRASYYHHWMQTLERILKARDVDTVGIAEIEDRIIAHANHSHHHQKEFDNTKPIAIG